MQGSNHTPLVKNKPFLIVLILAILCCLGALSAFIYLMTNLDSCIGWNACSEESSGYYSFCIKDGYKYCCGGWGSDKESCGKFDNSCRQRGSGYIDCGPPFSAWMWFNEGAFVLGIVLVVLGCLHRRN